MKQLIQNIRNGKVEVAEVPCPAPRRGTALVRTAISLISAGTERMVVEFAEKNLLNKARSRPDLVRQALEKARREGMLPTLQSIFHRLDQPMALGYSAAGTIVAVGEGLQGFQPGDRVACAGGGYAVHAEFIVVLQNLLVKIPDHVDFESAAFTTLGAIALHGFRLASPQVGESVAVIGLGLLGLLTCSIAHAAGCQVFGVDRASERVTLAEKLGTPSSLRENAETAARAFTRGRGFDVVLICADTPSSDPVELAGEIARDRARVVAVGNVGLNIPRKLYYQRELTFQVSRSYGPGRYDPAYEEKGQDYPIGYVRWSEGRNLEAIVDLMSTGRLDPRPLITHRFTIEEAPAAYELITGRRREPFLGVLLTYPTIEEPHPLRRTELRPLPSTPLGRPVVGVLGAGNYAMAVFLPVLQKAGGVELAGIASASGLSARHAAQKFGFRFAASDENEILDRPEINTVVVLTRHHRHAAQTLHALRSGKHVYCEKPLALKEEELEEIEAILQTDGAPRLMVGFNRRFAPLAGQLRAALLRRSEPLMAHYRVNAGFLPPTHWTQDPETGGGRMVGEGCHFIDFLTYLVGQPPAGIEVHALPDVGIYHQDNVLVTLTFPEGSVGTLAYLANGDRAVPKERLEIFCGGMVAILDDFRQLEITLKGRRTVTRLPFGQDKGHRAAWSAFVESIRTGGLPPIPYDQLLAVSRAAIQAQAKLSGAQR
jgi:predicted dehydrogenase/threonine dehydrogenase-like Zn-dependent dehydrogenase